MLVGRDHERSAVDDLLGAARAGRSGALLIRGAPGLGKSSLLASARDNATGMQVLQARGVESETELAFSGLHELLHHNLLQLADLPAPQAKALQAAFGMAEGARPDPFHIALAALGLLGEIARSAPVLVIVDDVQWLDRASTDVLTFVARRLGAEGIAVLMATRDTDPNAHAGIPSIDLGPLPDEAAGALIELVHGGPVAPEVHRRLRELARGNPLALTELATAMDHDELARWAVQPDPLPVTGNIEALYGERFARQPEGVQTLLLVAAAEDTGDVDVVENAAAALGCEPEDLAGAEASGMVSVSAGHVAFVHPLMRSAVYQRVATTDRRAAHAAIAGALTQPDDADRRAWHRASATVGRDDALAEDLVVCADRAGARSGYAAAAAALERSAELTSDDDRRAERYWRSAEAAWLAGRPEGARGLLDRAERVVRDGVIAAEISHLRGTIDLRCGNPQRAFDGLRDGAALAAPQHPEKAIDMLIEAAQAASYMGDAPRIVDTGLRAKALANAIEGNSLILDVVLGIGQVMTGDTASGVAHVRRAVTAADPLEDPRQLTHAANAAVYIGDTSNGLAYFQKAADVAQRFGAMSTLTYVLECQGMAQLVAGGRPDLAQTTAARAVELATGTGQENSVSRGLATLALVAAIRGDDTACRHHADQAMALALASNLGQQYAIAGWGLALLDLGHGRVADAADRLCRIAAAGPGTGHPFVRWVSAPDHVEATVRAGQPLQDDTLLAELESWGSATPWARAVYDRCEALLMPWGDEAEQRLTAALATYAAGGHTFDQARTALLLGERLRRAGRRADCRGHLRTASEAFHALRAAPWEARAREELRASGEHVTRYTQAATTLHLTAQELQIVRLVQTGMTSREVAAQLFLSPRTVEYHLAKVFTKLGINRRAQLADALRDSRLLEDASSV